MHFNFLNGLDCPDWLLAQIAHISKMTTIKYKLLCGLVLSRIHLRCKNEIDVSKYANATLDEESIQRILACTSYIMENALLSAVSSSDLILELEQLGMTSEHCRILSKVVDSSPVPSSTLLTPAKSPAIMHVIRDGNSLMIVDENKESYRVIARASQLEELRIEMARLDTVLSKIQQ